MEINDLMFNIFTPIIVFVFSYILGSIPTSVIIGKLLFNQDPRKLGSKNPGGTNSGRLWGKKIGATVMSIDILKGVLSFYVPFLIIRFSSIQSYLLDDVYEWTTYLPFLGCFLGHCYSIFLKFKGGKGVATYVGALGSTSIVQLILGFTTFMSILLKKKYVSLSSIGLAIYGFIATWIFYIIHLTCGSEVSTWLLLTSNILPFGLAYPIIVTIISFLLILRHSSNIKNLKKGKESKVKFLSK